MAVHNSIMPTFHMFNNFCINILKSCFDIFITLAFSSFWKTITRLMEIENYENLFSEQSEIIKNAILIKSLPFISYLKGRLFHTSTDIKY